MDVFWTELISGFAGFIRGLFFAMGGTFIKYLDYIANDGMMWAADLAFNAEYMMSNVCKFDKILTVIYTMFTLWIAVKFAVKMINIYMLRTDGDAEAEPMLMVINFFKALIVSICFGLLYSWFIEIVRDFLNKLIDASGINNNSFRDVIHKLGTFELVGEDIVIYVTFMVYCILFILLVGLLMVKGVQLTILRYGMLFATIGLLDADQGSYKPYIKKFLQIALTIILQVLLFNISIGLAIQTNYFYGLIVIITALTVPKFLSEFLIVGQGGNPMQGVYAANMISGMLGRFK